MRWAVAKNGHFSWRTVNHPGLFSEKLTFDPAEFTGKIKYSKFHNYQIITYIIFCVLCFTNPQYITHSQVKSAGHIGEGVQKT